MGKSLTELNKVLQEIDAELLPDSPTHKLRIKIKSETSNREYVVSKRDTYISQWECSCPGWTRHYPRKNCKHLNVMVPALEEIQQLRFSKPKQIGRKKTKKVVKAKETRVPKSTAKKRK